MKKNIIFILAATLLMSATSCSDFLDRYPLEELSDGSFWKTPTDAEMFVADIYNILPGSEIGVTDEDVYSDNAVHGIKWAYSGDVSEGIYLPQDFGWKGEYKKIRACNVLLEKIDMIADYPQTDKEATIAEARFLRGYIYYSLIRMYGDVPYVDGLLALDQLEGITRTPKEQVYEKIMEDFDYAISKLPLEWPSNKYGRATKGGARAMKAQCAMYFGKWQTAVDESKAIMESGQYALFNGGPDGSKLGEMFWEANEMSSEAVLVKQFNQTDKAGYTMMWQAFPTVGWGGLNPTQSLVDAFECIDGAPISKSSLYNPRNPRENRDPRLAATVLFDGEEMYGQKIKVAPLTSCAPTGIGKHGDATSTGYYQKKWLNPNIYPNWKEGRDWWIIRYAEVLLTYAEAKNEITALDQSAFDAVNQVRKRAGMPELQKTDPSKPTYCGTQDDLRKRIWNEWRVEFALEADKRQWDIRRWGIAKDVLNAPYKGLTYKLVNSPDADPRDGGQICILYVDKSESGATEIVLGGSHYEDHNYVYPIPQEEIDLNPGLKQNPGYN